ncbi:MAG: hypothetical protein LBJ00_01665 [Planctomycetaceae bacterium]|jgi:hypothetical protein|nr:hypothetical protein [Planctomycetaceae bacterium]
MELNTQAQQREVVVQGRSLPPIPASVYVFGLEFKFCQMIMERIIGLMFVIFIISSGCRMCGSDYDYCMPAIVDGGVQNAGPLYRAGSILNGVSDNCDNYFTDPDCAECNSNDSANFIEYRDTDRNIPDVRNNTFETYDDPISSSKGWQGTDTGTNIGIPKNAPNGNGNGNGNNNKNRQDDDLKFGTPSFDELFRITPPHPNISPKNNTPNTNPNTDPDNFTLDNLRQLDPTINDPNVKEVKIIKIENTPTR